MNLLPVKNQIIIGIDPLSKKEHPASLLIVLYNKGDDGNIDKKEFNQRVKDALEAKKNG